MKSLPSTPIPKAPQRIVLVNPTRYLGNLLLAGGLIQSFVSRCQARGQQLLVVLDDSFEDLCRTAFVPDHDHPDASSPRRPGAGRGPVLKQSAAQSPNNPITPAQSEPAVQILYYPRRQSAKAGPIGRLRLFLAFLNKIRQFHPDLAFNIEEDTTTSRLTQLSGARFRLGCSPARHGFGYDHVLPIQYADRPPQHRHRWHSFLEVFQAVGLECAPKNYLNLHINQPDESLIKKLSQLGVDTGKPLIAIHPSATKTYKLWPESAFSELCSLLIQKGFQPVLLGAGSQDATRCAQILEFCRSASLPPRRPGAGRGPDLKQDLAQSTPAAPIPNLCNQLSLRELAQFFLLCRGIVGNDSGPFHLAAAQGLPGVVVFGPSDAGIWGPLGDRSRVLQRKDLCAVGCSRRVCLVGYRCLQGVTAEMVMENLLEVMDRLGRHRVPGLDPGLRRGDEIRGRGVGEQYRGDGVLSHDEAERDI